MKPEIRKAIEELIPLYDEVDSSDLEGIATAKAYEIIKKAKPTQNALISMLEIMDLADIILEGAYDEINARERTEATQEGSYD